MRLTISFDFFENVVIGWLEDGLDTAVMRDGIGKQIALEKNPVDEDLYFTWNNPTPVLAAVAHRNDEIVLVQSIGWPSHWYSLVTGFMEAGESPEEGIAREIKEEIGLDCDVGDLLGVYEFIQMNQIIIAYDVFLADGKIKIQEEFLV